MWMKHFNHFTPPLYLLLSPSPFPLVPITSQFPILHWCHSFCFFRSSFCIWQRTCDICLCQSSLFHLPWWYPVISIFLQITSFHSSLWLSNTPFCVCVCVCVFICLHIFFTHLPVDGHLGWFHSLFIGNNSAIIFWNTLLETWLWAKKVGDPMKKNWTP
jgi:hypothetical protein